MSSQDASSRRDDEFVHNLNRLLADPSIIPVWDSRTAEPQPSISGISSSQTPTEPYAALRFDSSHGLPSFVGREICRRRSLQGQHRNNLRAFEHLSPPWVPMPVPTQVRRFICSLPFFPLTSSHPPIPDDELSLTDILTPSNLLPLFATHPELLSSLFPHLPPDLLPSGNAPLTPQQTAQLTETLQRTINSPPFRASVVQLDRALRTGALGSFVRSLGLPESAGTGVSAFLRAIGEQARRDGEGGGEQEDRMEED